MLNWWREMELREKVSLGIVILIGILVGIGIWAWAVNFTLPTPD
jgi:hypothetical protein